MGSRLWTIVLLVVWIWQMTLMMWWPSKLGAIDNDWPT